MPSPRASRRFEADEPSQACFGLSPHRPRAASTGNNIRPYHLEQPAPDPQKAVDLNPRRAPNAGATEQNRRSRCQPAARQIGSASPLPIAAFYREGELSATAGHGIQTDIACTTNLVRGAATRTPLRHYTLKNNAFYPKMCSCRPSAAGWFVQVPSTSAGGRAAWNKDSFSERSRLGFG